ncbi:MAG TPA: TldD/PmbA family protein [Firmicutes bacterium]|jgi:TldD protein|nr:TldD/PmbA family protein [Bacillota bacterium]
MVAPDLRAYAKFLPEYAELRWQENRSINISFLNGNITGNARSSSCGISARMYSNGSWGFASSPEPNAANIQAVIRLAQDNARFLDSREKKGKQPLPATSADSVRDFGTKKPKYTQKELLDFAKELDAHIAANYKDLTSRAVILNGLDMEKVLITSTGSYSHSLIPRSYVYVQMATDAAGSPVELGDLAGGLGQFEDTLTSPAKFHQMIAQLYEHLMHKREGVYADAGTKTCILGAKLGGILAHEAIGHTTEADLVLSGSVAKHLLNKEVAGPLVTLVDFAHTALGQICPVPVYVDDEGTPAQDVTIIDRGILKAYMHNKESALLFNTPPTGNARAFAFSDEPLIRMRNTAILPGNSKLEDMIASVDDGYYLIQPSNGQADSTSEFMFGVVLGYEIKKGKLGRAIRDTTISGVAYDVLKTVTMVSDDMHWSNGGMCGKKQQIPVGLGGPAIKCRINLGGR